MKKSLMTAALCTPLFAASHAFAENVPDTYWYIGANASQYFFYDNEVTGDVDGIDDQPFYGGQIGWRFSPHWSVQAWYDEADGDLESKYDSGERWDAKNIFASLRYHMDGVNFLGFEPYAGVNLGDFELENLTNSSTGAEGDKRHSFMTGVEVGIQRAFFNRVLLDLGTRQAFAADRDYWNGQVYAGLNVMFAVANEDDITETRTAAPAEVVTADSDGDGVPDDRDACPGTPAGAVVDERGCQIYENSNEQTINTIYFQFDKADIQGQFNDEVRDAADRLNNGEDGEIRIEGHTDSVGTDQYNQGLSERRAQSVKDALIENYKVDSSKVTTQGYGEGKPVAPNDTAEGRSKNRRAEIIVDTEQKEAKFKDE
ncbi:cell envelope biogenesis protein OmpA [Alcanivorax sp. N3-2A]|nr:cell envelope biogenesis protein OmpA [Alcanivorax sp. N3-2A]|tara:strand:+ start:2694 stop:3806 length:1113 start_codon:yes stop_codon:yes gene_type:complete